VTNGPLPPHERPWRHPSELAAPPPEPTTRSGRVLIISTATVSLLLVGALALAMTPGRARRVQDALVATTDLVVLNSAASAAAARPSPESSGGPGELPTTLHGIIETIRRVVNRSPAALEGASATGEAQGSVMSLQTAPAGMGGESALASPLELPPASASPVIVTPLGGGLAVTTSAALGAAGGAVRIAAVLPSGEAVEADVLSGEGGVVFVSIVTGPHSERLAPAGGNRRLAEMFVMVQGVAIPVDAESLASSNAPEGSPVVDADGGLLGLCTRGPEGVELVSVGSPPDVPGAGGVASSAPESSVTPSSPLGTDTLATSEPPASTATASTLEGPSTSAPESAPEPSEPKR
jgi:hypothetical protein